MLHQLADIWPSHPGFDAAGTITARFALNPVRIPSASARRVLYRSIVDRLAHDPAINGAAVASSLPMDRFFMAATIRVDTTDGHSPLELPDVQYWAVSPNFFSVLRIPIPSGRSFTSADDDGHPLRSS